MHLTFLTPSKGLGFFLKLVISGGTLGDCRSLSERPNTIMASVRGLLVFALAAYAFAVIEGVPDNLHLDRTDNTAEEILSSEGLQQFG